MNPKITKALLFDHYRGLASASQRRMIDEWAKLPENEEIFYRYLMEWEITHPQYTVNTGKGIERFREMVYDTSGTSPVYPLNHNRRRYFYAAACSAVFIISCGWIFQRQIIYQNLSTHPGEVKSWTLEDGSKVNLNSNSELTVPRWGFGSGGREVYLKGEAEFIVKHQTNGEKFVVKTADSVEVVVLGTEFTVYSRQDKTQILLSKGQVRVERQIGLGKREMLMAPGDRVTFDKGKVRQNRFDKPLEYAVWKESRFVFNKTSLAEIARLLQNTYDLKVEIAQPELALLTISGSFKALDHIELINSISQSLEIQYKVKGKRVIFSQDVKTGE
jgi:transmembrane sensor